MEGARLVEAQCLERLHDKVGDDGTLAFVGAPPLWARDQILPLVAARAAATSAASLPAPCPAASPLSPAARSGPPLLASPVHAAAPRSSTATTAAAASETASVGGAAQGVGRCCSVAKFPLFVLSCIWKEWIVGTRKTVCLQVAVEHNAYVIFDISNITMGLLTGLKMVSISPDRSLRQFRDVNFPLPQHREYRQALRNQSWCVFRDHRDMRPCRRLFVCKLVEGNIEEYLALQYPALRYILSMEFEADGNVLDILYVDGFYVFCTYLDLNEVWNERQIMQLPNCSKYSTAFLGIKEKGKRCIQLGGGLLQFTTRRYSKLVGQRILDYNRGNTGVRGVKAAAFQSN
ncbi:hypothetical protein Pelo_9638 [Pelomyxa schiedti]|nr:hypothetical protein Pelo_9638 [Pelomyxa schiedti]